MKKTGERLENGKIMIKDFPKQVFDDIKNSDFKKYNKKDVSKDLRITSKELDGSILDSTLKKYGVKYE
jgi:FPC/CPF motif-containing protein YcgG